MGFDDQSCPFFFAQGLAVLMRRLLTGYAVSFNHRHRRHGQFFQNRYKSIICQEDAYLKELVRYIYLNPLRANMVNDFRALDHYAFSGHRLLAGKGECGGRMLPMCSGALTKALLLFANDTLPVLSWLCRQKRRSTCKTLQL